MRNFLCFSKIFILLSYIKNYNHKSERFWQLFSNYNGMILLLLSLLFLLLISLLSLESSLLLRIEGDFAIIVRFNLVPSDDNRRTGICKIRSAGMIPSSLAPTSNCCWYGHCKSFLINPWPRVISGDVEALYES